MENRKCIKVLNKHLSFNFIFGSAINLLEQKSNSTSITRFKVFDGIVSTSTRSKAISIYNIKH